MPTLSQFFEAQTPAAPMTICRIAIGLAAAVRSAMQYGLLRQLYSGEVIPLRNIEWLPDFPPVLVFLSVATSLAFAVGFHTRITGALTLAFFLYQFLLDSNLYANNTYLLILILFLVTLPNSTTPTIPRWQSLLPRLQVTIVYVYSVLFKINPEFLTGQTTAEAMRLPASWLSTPIPALLAIAALALELAIPIVLWIPRLRPTAFVMGALLHLGIVIGMERHYTGAMLCFGTTMLAPFLLFLENPPRSRTVLWDANCSFCRQTIRLLQLLDWLHIHNFQPSTDPSLTEIKLTYDNQTRGGFDAFREILCLQPLSYLWAPILALPPINALGHKVYKYVAARRHCSLKAQ
jgi:predicted DCC family thiol-disulfide oxidoreductase YuxK